MRFPNRLVWWLFVCFLTSPEGMAQTFDLQFLNVFYNRVNYDVKIQMKSNDSTFRMGSSNLVFSYNTSALSSPTLLVPHNFSGGNYVAMNIQPGPPVSTNIELALAPGTTVPLTYVDVATIRFTVLDTLGSSNLQWLTADPLPTVVYKDDEATPVPVGTLHNLNSNPLPIQLASFTAVVVSQSRVRLDWTTLSELNNFGFYVQRRRTEDSLYTELPNSFIPGNGTTTEPHNYSYTDSTLSSGNWWYRLKQVDLDGTIHFTDGVQAEVPTSVREEAPRVFALLQNYPNPFNPTTEIKFSVETTAHTTLSVYNVIGQRVATLFDEVAEAGQYYRVRLNASGFASGLYFYKLDSDKKSDLKKMLLLK